MFKRYYTVTKKRIRKCDGVQTFCKFKIWRWRKTNKPQRKNKPAGTGMQMWSKRFGYMDMYTDKERQQLRCPSGYSFNQGMGKLFKLWYGYKRGLEQENIEKMEKYARAIQDTQEDMGLKTSSFPHLGIYGDTLVFRDYKTGQLEETDHSELKEKQDMEKAKEKLEEIIPLIQPDLEKGEELIAITDEVPIPEPEPEPEPRYKIKHDNRMHYNKKQKEEYDCHECGERVPAGKKHICCNEEKGESVLVMTDDIPFMDYDARS